VAAWPAVPAKLPLVLLPPSEGKSSGGDGPPWRPGTMAVDLDDERREVCDALVAAMRRPEADRARLLGVKGDALRAATAADLAVLDAPTTRAVERYTGVLYAALDHRSLGATPRRRLASSVLVFSGLWGLVAARDPIPDYKLKMGASLPATGRLSTWWRPRLTEALVPRGRGRTVWNLLPQEHDAAWDAGAVDAREVLSVRFGHVRPDGSLAAVSHWNKHLKGALVRFLLERPDAAARDLARWEHPAGYRLDPERTERRGGVTQLTLVGPALGGGPASLSGG